MSGAAGVRPADAPAPTPSPRAEESGRLLSLRIYRPASRAFGPFEWAGALGLALLFPARFVPLARWIPFWGCNVRRLTGLPCPSCGMTRAFDWFARGRFGDALAISPLGFALATAAAAAGLWLLLSPLRPPRLAIQLAPKGRRFAWLLAGAAVLANWSWVVAARS